MAGKILTIKPKAQESDSPIVIDQKPKKSQLAEKLRILAENIEKEAQRIMEL
jgi:hypothetical protein